MTDKELLELKGKVETVKQTVSEYKGQQTGIIKQLKDDFGCKTIEEAEKKLKVLDKEIEELDQQIEDNISEIEEKYKSE